MQKPSNDIATKERVLRNFPGVRTDTVKVSNEAEGGFTDGTREYLVTHTLRHGLTPIGAKDGFFIYQVFRREPVEAQIHA